MFFAYLLFGVLLTETSATWTCNDDELPCLASNGTCVSQQQWCDDEINCPDGSDEYFCNRSSCLEDHFTCRNRRCIPFVAVCNGYDNCGDGSDEECESSRNATEHPNALAVVLAAQYLLSERKSDYGWDDFTPRALTALAFAEKYLPIPERVSMMKRLHIQLLLLLRNPTGKLASLALHINALYAMCKDPRNFHGIDLVELLRSETDMAMKSDFNLPIVILTLCIAKEAKYRDLEELVKIYDKSSDRMGVKALTIIAMAFCNRQADTPHALYGIKRDDFIQSCNIHDSNIDVYTKGLIYQAYIAIGYDTSPFHFKLLELQSESGSFEDLFGTYSVIPVLLNMSLANLQCKKRNYEVKLGGRSFATPAQLFKPEKQMDYSLWIPDGESVGHHSLKLTFEGEKSFYDIMKMAEQQNPLFRFKYEEVEEVGKRVYSLAGIPNDAETGSTWMLYKKYTISIEEYAGGSTQDARKETNGVDRIFPQDKDHFIFQLEHF